jgi:phosphoribosylanthranilate isomerase
VNVRVKICGVTSVEDALLAVQCGADLIGLNFYPLSPRYLSLEQAKSIRAVLPSRVWCVGLFVNADRELIASLTAQLQLDAIQFHGEETATDIQGWTPRTIKALRVSAEGTLPEWQHFPTDYLLLDTYKPGRYGGTGETFAWVHAAALPLSVRERLILAGGLTPDNVAAAVGTVRPWAVDVASGVESTPGRKDPKKLREFIAHAKTT